MKTAKIYPSLPTEAAVGGLSNPKLAFDHPSGESSQATGAASVLCTAGPRSKVVSTTWEAFPSVPAGFKPSGLVVKWRGSASGAIVQGNQQVELTLEYSLDGVTFSQFPGDDGYWSRQSLTYASCQAGGANHPCTFTRTTQPIQLLPSIDTTQMKVRATLALGVTCGNQSDSTNASGGIGVYDIHVVVAEAPPELTLFLDVDGDFDSLAPQSDRDLYLPCANLDGVSSPVPGAGVNIQTVHVVAAYVDHGGSIVSPPTQSQAQFWLEGTTAFLGVAMNWGDDSGPDWSLNTDSAPFSAADHTARVLLTCHDYGGKTTVRVNQGLSSASLIVPRDEANVNMIADGGWRVFGRFWNELAQEWQFSPLESIQDDAPGTEDQDSIPAGVGLGDNLTRFEEYRGFVMEGVHYRTSPSKKDVFMNDYFDDSLASGFTGTGLRWHRVRLSEISQTRRVNFNAGGIPGHTDQQVIIGYNAGEDEQRIAAGSTPCHMAEPFTCSPNIVGSVHGGQYESLEPLFNVKIYEGNIRWQSPEVQSVVIPDAVDPEAFRSAAAHELGHAVGIFHSSSLTSIMRPKLVYDNDWGSIMHLFEPDDLTQIRVK